MKYVIDSVDRMRSTLSKNDFAFSTPNALTPQPLSRDGRGE